MGINFKDWRTKISTEILILILTGFNFILIIFMLPFFFIPLTLYKSFVVRVAKYLRPELTHTLNVLSIHAIEDVTKQGKFNVIGCFICEGDISQRLEEIQSLFKSRVLEKTDENGQLVYPELRQIWTSFMGYFFWTNASHFDIKEHIRIFDGRAKIHEKEIYTERDLKEIATRLLSEPWKQDFSPWEFLIVPNYHGSAAIDSENSNKKGKSVVIVRFHHVVGDGKGWQNIVINDLFQCQDVQLPKMAKWEKPTWWQNLLLWIKLPHYIAENSVEVYEPTDPFRNPWHTPEKRAKKYYTSLTAPIPVQRFKDLKNKFGVSFEAIMIHVVSGGIRRIMKEAGQNVPQDMRASLMLPLPNHPGKICFHAGLINSTWPTVTEDPIQRLDQVWRNMSSKRSSLAYFNGFLILKMGAIFPKLVLRMIYNKTTVSICSSFFPGPLNNPKFLGHKVVDLIFFFAIPPGQIGATVTSIVMGGNQRIAVTIDKTLYPSQNTFEKLGGFIEEELRELESASVESFDLKCKKSSKIDVTV